VVADHYDLPLSTAVGDSRGLQDRDALSFPMSGAAETPVFANQAYKTELVLRNSNKRKAGRLKG
jgi:hypothetical protein